MPRARVKKLTQMQERYCQERANGADYATAWGNAGYSTKCKRSNQRSDAYHMEVTKPSAPLIQARIKELQAAAEEGAILDRQARQAFLTGIALDENEKTDNRLRAADMLNRMSGDYTDTVRSVVSGGVSLTYEERMKLIEDQLKGEE